MTISRPLPLFALALWALAATPSIADTVLANYTLDFKPPSPNCSASGLGDLAGATLGGALGVSYLDSSGARQQPPGPPNIPGVTCGGSVSGSFSFEVPDASAGLFVSLGGNPASLSDPGTAPWLAMPPGPPTRVQLYAFSGGAYPVGTLDITLQAVPVPGALWLFGSGLLGMAGIRRRRDG
ncbi:MAG: PEP-CTERM sorting domain-containing protein [Gammaproteobacteria bacterium]